LDFDLQKASVEFLILSKNPVFNYWYDDGQRQRPVDGCHFDQGVGSILYDFLLVTWDTFFFSQGLTFGVFFRLRIMTTLIAFSAL
jgi:hypothetical protein